MSSPHEIDMEDILNCEDPPDFDWISIKHPSKKYVKMEFSVPLLPNLPI